MESIGRYQIVGEVGKGAMGIVYRALDPTIGREVALKTMRVDVHGLENAEVLRRFRNEARAAGTLNHPNLVTIYDAGEQDGIFYIAMELIEGRTLASILAEQRVLPVEQIISIARQVSAGLDYAHTKGVVHRDIKPANIMITADGTAKIMDFGIAKSGGGMTSAGQVLGTPNYMAPEQVQGKPLDGRSDLFSLGVILYEMLTGERPFMGQNVTTIIYKIVHERPIAPRDLDVSIHPGLNAVVTKALAKSPDERYQTGADLARDLVNYKQFGGGDPGATQAMETSTFTSAATVSVSTGTAIAVPPTRIAISQTAETVRIPAPPELAPVTAPKAPAAPVPSAAKPRKKSNAALIVVAAVVIIAVALAAFGFWRRAKSQQAKIVAPVASAPTPTQPQAAAAQTARDDDEQPAPASSPGVTGSARFETTPAGASIQIDGRSSDDWLTPYTLASLKPGPHTAILRMSGYSPERRTFEVAAGKRVNIAAALTPVVATLDLNSDPIGAKIVIDGKLTAETTPAKINLPPGSHNVALRMPGYEEASETVTLTDGQTHNFAPQLAPKRDTNAFGRLKRFFGARAEDKGLVIVRTRPEGAHVIVNNVVVPGVTPLRAPAPVGDYSITIRLPGYRLLQKRITVEKGKATTVDEVLTRE